MCQKKGTSQVLLFPQGCGIGTNIEGWVGFLPVEVGEMLGAGALSCSGPDQF